MSGCRDYVNSDFPLLHSKSTSVPCQFTFSVICALLHFSAVNAANICHDELKLTDLA